MADEKTTESTKQNRTAGETGWHVSRYNLSAPVPGTKKVAIANLFRGTCAEYTPIEGYLMSVLDELDEHHPIIERLAKRGVICNFDEEAVDKPQFSFGTAHDWNPEDPLGSASNADNLTMYLNTASPLPDDECTECVWLPMCVGGCLHARIIGRRRYVAFKDDPEAYVLALHAHIGKDKADNAGDASDADNAGDAPGTLTQSERPALG